MKLEILLSRLTPLLKNYEQLKNIFWHLLDAVFLDFFFVNGTHHKRFRG